MSDDGIELTPDLLADFYAECDEQLSNIRAHLAILEQAPNAERAAPALETIYRNVHSFKGNAAIVGLGSAEQLAHAAEGLLRQLTRGEAALDAATLDLLARVSLRLEQTVVAFRASQPLPKTDDLLAALGTTDAGVPAAAAPSGAATAVAPVAAASGADRPMSAPDAATYRATFRPTPELDARGVNVNEIRTRIAALGPIVAAKPVVESAGAIRFEFSAALPAAPADLDAWTRDGVAWEPASVPAAPDPETSAAAPAVLFSTASHIVRVDLSRLDELMRIIGEMVIQRSRLQERIAQLPGDVSALQEVNLGLTRSLRDLRAAIMRVRMVPVMEVFSRLPFVVRDLTREGGKTVRLVMEGQETEIDKYLVERLKEPLLHLVRNAISHGIEPAAERPAAGKPAEATLRLRASAAGDAVEIRIRDDGRGIDARSVAARAQAAGLDVPAVLDDPALLRLLCTPGFSTRDEADRAAGRGVGMAVVDSTVRELGGVLSLATERGRFTEFTVRLPLTLSIADTFIVAAGAQLCAVPQGFVEEVIQLSPDHVRPLNGSEVGPFRGTLVPLIRLRRLFGMEPAAGRDTPVLVLKTDRGAAGLVVDRVIGQREIVVRPMQDPLLRVPGISGATELGDGKPVLILDAGTLMQAAVQARTRPVHRSTPLALTAS